MAFRRAVAGAEEGQIDHAESRHVLVDQTEGHSAQRDAVQEVGGSVDRVEHPHQTAPGVGRGSFLFPEEPDLGCFAAEEVTDGVLYGAASTGASLKELMSRMGHSSTRAALIYQHASQDRDRTIAQALGSAFRAARETKIENAGGT
nr:hypothetical protein [Streptosporangium roseum]